MGAEDPPPLVGVPTAVFVKVIDGPNPERTAVVELGEDKIDVRGKIFESDGCYDKSVPNEQVFTNVLGGGYTEDPNDGVIKSFVDESISACIIITGANASGKRELFQGSLDTDSDLGMIGWVMDPIFANLRDKNFNSATRFHEFSVAISAFEIFDEIITDLIEPSNEDLSVHLHLRHGFVPQGLSRAPVSAPRDALRLLQSARRNRRMQRLVTGPTQHSTSAVVIVHLTQSIGDSRQDYDSLSSSLFLVETPGTNVLSMPQEQVVLRQGPHLYRSLFTFVEVCRSLASGEAARFAPFQQSKLTQALQDSLGGASQVLAIVCLSRSDEDSAIQNSVMLGKNMQLSLHYPLPSTENLQGVLYKLRCLLASHIEAAKGEKTGGDSEAVEKLISRMKEVEGDLLKSQLELSTAREDSVKVFKMLEIFKKKYSALVESKSKQSQELITAEEQKLETAQALLDLRLEHSKLQEKFEADRYGLASELLVANSEVTALDQRLKDSEASRLARQREAEVLLQERDRQAEQVKAAQQEAKSARSALELEEAKSVEIGAELLTLANRKAVIEGMCETLEKKNQDLTSRLQKALENQAPLDVGMQKLREEAAKDKMRADTAELDKKRLQVELEQLKSTLENARFTEGANAMESTNAKTAELLEGQMKAIEEVQRARDEHTKSASMISNLQQQTRMLQRRASALETDLQRRTVDYNQCTEEKAVLQVQLRALQERFSGKLASLLAGAAHANRRKSDSTLNNNSTSPLILGESSTSTTVTREAVLELISGWQDRLNYTTAQYNEEKKRSGVLLHSVRDLYDRLIKMKDIAEDRGGTGSDQSSVLPNIPTEQELLKSASLPQTEPEELISLKEQLQQAQNQLSTHQERHVNVIDEYQSLLRNQENQTRETIQTLALLKQENIAIRAELEAARDGSAIKRLEDMQRALLDQLVALKEGGVPLRRKNKSHGKDRSDVEAALTEQLSESERRCAVLLTRSTMLESELENYKKYVQQMVRRYQEKILQLKTEATSHKTSNSDRSKYIDIIAVGSGV